MSMDSSGSSERATTRRVPQMIDSFREQATCIQIGRSRRGRVAAPWFDEVACFPTNRDLISPTTYWPRTLLALTRFYAQAPSTFAYLVTPITTPTSPFLRAHSHCRSPDSPIHPKRLHHIMRRTMAAQGVLVLLVACACGSVQGQFDAMKKMAGGASMETGEMSQQFKANAEAVKASMAGSK